MEKFKTKIPGDCTPVVVDVSTQYTKAGQKVEFPICENRCIAEVDISNDMFVDNDSVEIWKQGHEGLKADGTTTDFPAIPNIAEGDIVYTHNNKINVVCNNLDESVPVKCSKYLAECENKNANIKTIGYLHPNHAEFYKGLVAEGELDESLGFNLHSSVLYEDISFADNKCSKGKPVSAFSSCLSLNDIEVQAGSTNGDPSCTIKAKCNGEVQVDNGNNASATVLDISFNCRKSCDDFQKEINALDNIYLKSYSKVPDYGRRQSSTPATVYQYLNANCSGNGGSSDKSDIRTGVSHQVISQ